MDNELPVYLDHHIDRVNLRYQRSNDSEAERTRPPFSTLDLCDLVGDHTASRDKALRKPDFQRATWAWSPAKCVSLLASILNRQVVPAVIMWRSADSRHDFVLDGAHRISVVMAWLRDDWGQFVADDPNRSFDDPTREQIRQAANTVRDLVRLKIGTFDEVKHAAQRVDQIVDDGGAPGQILDARTMQQARMYHRISGRDINFAIQWEPGDYAKAEQSFLDINTGGQPLTDWEITLIKNRDSSFARTVMSVSSVATARHYWPDDPPNAASAGVLRSKIGEIVLNVESLQHILFDPPYEPQIKQLQQPILAQPDLEKRPYWLAELLTVISGGKGQLAETERLLQRDQSALPEDIIHNGHRLIEESLSALEHISGASPKSMCLIPALYFYSDKGRYVRSLLYGLIYWLVSGDDETTVLERKRAFAAHRGAFETVLRATKGDLVNRLARNSGSGSEVTYPTARYYQGLMELLISEQDNLSAPTFKSAYARLLEGLTDRKSRALDSSNGEVKSRNFTERQKSTLFLKQQLDGLDKCGICGGLLDPEMPVQHDHIMERYRAGTTSADNQRMVHPFCNNQSNRELIEAMRRRDIPTRLPPFVDPLVGEQIRQLSFFDTPDFI